MKRVVLGCVSSAVVLLAIILPSACKNAQENVIGQPTATDSATQPVIVPYLPPGYYQCIEVLPVDLEATFHTAYGNHAEAAIMYDDKTFLFRNLLVDLYMIRELGTKGWLWADLTECPVINMDYAETLKPGNRVDIVGICVGWDDALGKLIFKDCYILPTGSLQLPAPGGATFVPVY
jgi:hypothetical protein